MKDNKQEIEEIIRLILEKMTIVFDDIVVTDSYIKGNTNFLIKTKESGLLIGSEGETLISLNHVIKEIVKNRILNEGQKPAFFVDVNNYYDQKIQKIKLVALGAAKKAKMFKRDVEMDPMFPHERLIVHSVLEDDLNVLTESDGEGVFRRVIVKFRQ